MADNSISGVYRIIPAHPVRPPQPADKEREQPRKRRDIPEPRRQDDDDADDKPVIDEYV